MQEKNFALAGAHLDVVVGSYNVDNLSRFKEIFFFFFFHWTDTTLWLALDTRNKVQLQFKSATRFL
jgi:hypothetical protein